MDGWRADGFEGAVGAGRPLQAQARDARFWPRVLDAQRVLASRNLDSSFDVLARARRHGLQEVDVVEPDVGGPEAVEHELALARFGEVEPTLPARRKGELIARGLGIGTEVEARGVVEEENRELIAREIERSVDCGLRCAD